MVRSAEYTEITADIVNLGYIYKCLANVSYLASVRVP